MIASLITLWFILTLAFFTSLAFVAHRPMPPLEQDSEGTNCFEEEFTVAAASESGSRIHV
jgi:hypothetical protein